MGVQALEVGYTSATAGRVNHEVPKGHVVALEKKNNWDTKLTYDRHNIAKICELSLEINFPQKYCFLLHFNIVKHTFL
jgi:hypothetical protein